MGKKLEAYKEKLYNELVDMGVDCLNLCDKYSKKTAKNADSLNLMFSGIYLNSWENSSNRLLCLESVSEKLFGVTNYMSDVHECYEEQKK